MFYRSMHRFIVIDVLPSNASVENSPALPTFGVASFCDFLFVGKNSRSPNKDDFIFHFSASGCCAGCAATNSARFSSAATMRAMIGNADMSTANRFALKTFRVD